MNLAISTLSCPEWTLDQIIEAASRLGIGGIDFRGIGPEIDITRLREFNEGLDGTLAKLSGAGLTMPCLNSSITLVTPLPDRWNQMLEEAQRSAALAGRTGTKLVRIFGGGVPEAMTREEARSLARRHLRQLIKIVTPFGCKLLLETHDDWSTSEQVLQIVGEFTPAEVGVLWDFEHPFRKGESPADTHERLARYVDHVHIKDAVRIDGRSVPKLLGGGELPLPECLALLKGSGYAGWISLECEKRWHADAPAPEQSLPDFVRFMGSF